MPNDNLSFPPLSGPTLAPVSGGKPKQIVLLLHGVGSNGADLIQLAPQYAQVLPDALFVSPNAPFPFDMAPSGFMWFSLEDFSASSRLRGVQAAAPILDGFIDHLLAQHGLAEENMMLVGFSQGTMMALHVGLRRPRPLAGIIGHSGMLVGEELLNSEIASRPPVLLTHGEQDEMLPIACLDGARRGLEALDVKVQAHARPGLGHGIDDGCLRLGMAFMAGMFGLHGMV